MSRTLDRIRDEALSMPEADRVDLLNALAGSIHEDPAPSEAWMEEIRRRRDQIERGEVEPIDADEAFARARARLG